MKRNQVLDINKSMENTTKKHGGARKGAGRPRGTGNAITVKELLDAVQAKANGKSYEEILAKDFMEAQASGDLHLLHKWHTLILSKVMSTVSKVEVHDARDTIEAKQAAFAEALNKFKEQAEQVH